MGSLSKIMLLIILLAISLPFVMASDDDLILHMTFDESSGNIAHDSSNYNNFGIVHGAKWADGICGNALDFDGVNDHVIVDYDNSLDTEEITITSWIKIDALPTTVTKYGGFVARRSSYRYYVNRYGAFHTRVIFTDGSTITKNIHHAFKLGQWYHVAMTYDGEYLRAYINGVEMGSTFGGKTLRNLVEPIEIGRIWENSKYSFDGEVDDVRIYNRALSPTEIRNAASCQKKGEPGCNKPGCYARFKIDFTYIYNLGAGNTNDKVFVGPNAEKYGGGDWIELIDEDGNLIIDDDFVQDVPGVAVKREFGRVLFLFYGMHPGAYNVDREHVRGKITFDRAYIREYENGLWYGPMDNEDNIWWNKGTKSAKFESIVRPHIDSFYLYYSFDGLYPEGNPRKQISWSHLNVINDEAKPSEDVMLFIDLENSDVCDMEHVKITATIPELAIRGRVGPFDLTRRDRTTKTIVFNIPDYVKPGVYDVRVVISEGGKIKRIKHREITVI